MDGRTAARRLIEVAALVGPLAIGLLVPPRLLPRVLAFALASGWWLAAAGVVATLLAVALPPWRGAHALGRVASRVLHGRRAWPALFLLGFLVAVLGRPGWRQVGPAAGDEPRYLRIAWSLYHDLDADVSSNQEGALTAARLAGNAQRLARSTAGAFATLLSGEGPRPDHAWSLGNLTVAAWHGGAYHVFGPGLPALLAPAVGLAPSQEEWPTVPRHALTVMALVFALAFAQTALLAGDLSGSRAAGALAATLVVLSPAVFVGGYHLYPDAVAAAAVPWLARHAWAEGPPVRPARVAALGLVAGGLVWLHVKFLLLAAASTMLLGLRLRRSRSLALLAAGALAPVAAWLLFLHDLTGLLRPDALYIRFGSRVWHGASPDIAWRFVGGLGSGLFGARDGIYVMVPVVAVASLGVPWLWRRDRQAVAVLSALFASVWWAAAVHGGGAPGPPGRLLSPAAPLFAGPLAVALLRLRGSLAFRWSLGAAAIVSLAVVAAMGANPRLTVNPYRGVPADVDPTRDLPTGRSDPAGATRDLARAGLLLVAVAFWAARFSRRPRSSPPETGAAGRAGRVWREAVAFQLGAWLTLAAVATALQALTAIDAAAAATGAPPEPIDRRALVSRHDPVLRSFDTGSPLSVGNGELAFTADATGLQTFADAYDSSIPLGTLSQWGWHTSPNPQGWSIDRFRFTELDANGRKVGYADIPGDRRTPEIEWLRANPHRLHLGRIGFRLTRADGREAAREDLTDVEQVLDLWHGVLRSRFRLDGERVEVETLCHPRLDLVAVRAVSPLVRRGRLAIRLRFPYGSGDATAADWTRPEAHETDLVRSDATHAELARRLDADRYSVRLAWQPAGAIAERERHLFLVEPGRDGDALEAVVAFSPTPGPDRLPGFEEARRAAAEHWGRFWTTGGAIDLSGSRDPRWRELERRIVLSQYLTAIQCAGRYPPQETGLTFNSWEGKFHLEMHWWHAVHFALWGRLPLLERSLGYYSDILPRARQTARRQGYPGARWPKMTDPSGAESPSSVGPFLVWQQPHPIYYAELVYRQRGDRATLERFRDVVHETAEFMAAFASWDEAGRRYVLGPVLQGAQEIFPKDRTVDTAFEVAYWRWGLEAAQRWRERLGLAREPRWQRVLDRLAPLPVRDGKYLFAETAPDSFTDPRWARDHPSVTGALGVLPGDGVDRATMQRTLDWVWANWSWPDTWGWDYPMLAMCAARLGQPGRAIDALLLDVRKNAYRANGHNHQRPGLTVYLPGNGGLLAAVAMMAAGWDGAPERRAPGFPADGSWTVRWESLRRMP